MTIYSGERLRLAGLLAVVELHVHLGRPGPSVEVGDHALEYTRIVFHGHGAFTVLRHGRQMWRCEQ